VEGDGLGEQMNNASKNYSRELSAKGHPRNKKNCREEKKAAK
jgi:hypothetical protein